MEGLEGIQNRRGAEMLTLLMENIHSLGLGAPRSYLFSCHTCRFSLGQEHSKEQPEQDDPHSLWGDVEGNVHLGLTIPASPQHLDFTAVEHRDFRSTSGLVILH